jgi:hypothetical protein
MKFNLLIAFWGRVPRTVGIEVQRSTPYIPVIESSKGSPPGEGRKHNFTLNGVPDATMSRKHKKRRTEAQRCHDILLHESRHNPTTYYAATLEDVTGMVKEQRERARKAEEDAECAKKSLVSAQNQVCSLMIVNERMV